MRSRPRRGQTLILMALTLIVLTGMVLATLNLASRVKGRLEMQTLADVTAYTNAVATARAFNGVSLMNRAALSVYAAQAGAAALMAYGSQGLAFNRALSQSLANSLCLPVGSACCVPHDTARDVAIAALDQRYTSMMAQFEGLDQAGRTHLLENQMSAVNLREANLELLLDMQRQVAGQGPHNEMSQRVLDVSKLSQTGAGPVEWLDTMFVNKRETTNDLAANLPGYILGGPPVELPSDEGKEGSGAIKFQGGAYNDLMVEWALGTRREWMASYSSAPHGDDLSACQSSGFVCGGSGTGAGYWSVERHGGPNGQTRSWGDGEGVAFANGAATVAPPCSVVPASVPANAHVRTTHLEQPDGQHSWTGAETGQGDEKHKHVVGLCVICPSVWVRPFRFNWEDKDEADAWGQPKNYAALRKDLAAETEQPWHRIFSIKMPGESTATWNVQGRVDDLDCLRYQHAIGTGLAYYHRAQNWQEPANLMNPFWRATLTHGFIDESAKSDFNAIFVGGSTKAIEGINSLAEAKHAAMK